MSYFGIALLKGSKRVVRWLSWCQDLLYKSGCTNLIPRTHIKAEREKWLYKIVSHLHIHTVECTLLHSHLHIHTMSCTLLHSHLHMHTMACPLLHLYCICTQWHAHSCTHTSTPCMHILSLQPHLSLSKLWKPTWFRYFLEFTIELKDWDRFRYIVHVPLLHMQRRTRGPVGVCEHTYTHTQRERLREREGGKRKSKRQKENGNALVRE